MTPAQLGSTTTDGTNGSRSSTARGRDTHGPTTGDTTATGTTSTLGAGPERSTARNANGPTRGGANISSASSHCKEIAQGVAAMALLGSSTGVTAQLTHFPVLGGQAVRYLLSAIVLIAMARRAAPVAKPTAREWALLATLSLVGLVVFNVLAIAALRHADPATLGSALACSPLVLALGGPIVRRRGGRSGAGARVLFAAAMVVGGSVLVQGFGHGGLTGTLLSVGVLLCEALFSLLAVPLLPKFGAVRVSAYTTSIAVPVLTVAGLATGGTTFLRMPTATEAACIAFLGLPLTVGAFVLWYRCLGGLGPDRAGLLIGVVPITAVVSGVVVGEGLPSVPRLVGVLAVAVGAAFGLASPASVQGMRDRVLRLVQRQHRSAGQSDGREDSPALLAQR